MYSSLKENISALKELFANSADLTVREMNLNSSDNKKAAIVTIEGMCSKDTVAISIIEPLLDYKFAQSDSDSMIDEIQKSVLTSSEIVKFNTLEETVMFATSGFALILLDGTKQMLAIGSQGFSFRSVTEPESEVVQRGSREGFTEPLRINMTLIRRRIKSPDLVFETVTVGKNSKTQLMLCYLQKSVSTKNILITRINAGL